ncbi:MAG: CbbQ/NirQ/NorQ/GpvN family protein [Chloroflexota bacterium]|nr:AAA family ATPase [Chloroflexota bacterium]MQF83742.1 CbbQ/NirQ/NorQ/GpvN family protein [SAR202 cluster bacterium]MEC9098956.1 CbbQ/NirQ/NorQ/GpvN family protein [Chloroflexota bacterium]MEC9107396.1 CbbQ/NirQ/NorQ/GpvN family protein [Chloroflexota bacterium]MED5254661.1 CbbQ/NirQ/NorQ/GpvN family protein [Chloroflexota bacterium]|tara:strand:+ start:1270 stop:2118 length:849 start_codon:yes stop_codon:yes gene_type:complete
MATQSYKEVNAEEYIVAEEPFFMPTSDEIEVFQAAYNERVPILLKGPTGTGKTRFVEYMSWKINSNENKVKDIPLVTVACHEDLTASDLVGRYLLDASGTKWIDGPLTRAVKSGGICYLDEVVEARKDTTVIIHPLTDHRRTLSIDKLGQVIQADDGFLLVVSYNPGYQNAVKDLKHSTRQRFVAIEFDFPDVDRETKIIAHESGLEEGMSNQLAVLGQKIRNLREHGLEEGASTRLLIYAARLIKQGISPKRACQVALTWGITDEVQIQETVDQIVSSIFE